jgi:hypothetical protein
MGKTMTTQTYEEMVTEYKRIGRDADKASDAIFDVDQDAAMKIAIKGEKDQKSFIAQIKRAMFFRLPEGEHTGDSSDRVANGWRRPVDRQCANGWQFVFSAHLKAACAERDNGATLPDFGSDD